MSSTEPPQNNGTDTIFNEPKLAADFCFDRTVAQVFDNMVDRSVPYYQEIQRMIAEQAATYAVDGTNLYDLGCATGTTLLALDHDVSPDVHFVGIDNSTEMLDRCRAKLNEYKLRHKSELICADLNKLPLLKNASVVLLVLTLQFVRPPYRRDLLQNIYNSLNDGGCLILVEKVLGENTVTNRDFIRYYYDMKRRHGYKELEIAQKREALENVLIPYKQSENIELLSDIGFCNQDIFFKWYNFCGFVAFKS